MENPTFPLGITSGVYRHMDSDAEYRNIKFAGIAWEHMRKMRRNYYYIVI